MKERPIEYPKCPLCGKEAECISELDYYIDITVIGCPECGLYAEPYFRRHESDDCQHEALENWKKIINTLKDKPRENAAKLETIEQYVLNVLNDSATDSLPEWWTPHTVATTINRIITAAPVPAELHTRLGGAMNEAGKEVRDGDHS